VVNRRDACRCARRQQVGVHRLQRCCGAIGSCRMQSFGSCVNRAKLKPYASAAPAAAAPVPTTASINTVYCASLLALLTASTKPPGW